MDLLDQKFERRRRDLVGRGWHFACPDTDSFSARCQNREGHSPLAIHTAAFVHVLVLLAAGFALCFGESINLTWQRLFGFTIERTGKDSDRVELGT